MKRSKYKAVPCYVDGIRFASKLEAKRYSELLLLQRDKQIYGLALQPKFPIVIDGRPVLIKSKGYPNGRKMVARMDFAYAENGKEVIEDVKGMDNPASRIKRALVEAIYQVEVRIVR